MTKRMARLPLVAAAVGIMGLLSGAVATGQSGSPADPMADTHFTGTYTATASNGPSLQQGGGYQEVAGVTEEGTVSATDPRINGTWHQVRNMRLYPKNEIAVSSGSVRIDNANGSWSGTFTGAYTPDGFAEEWNILTGSGAYEGLTAIFHWSGDDSSLEGVIVPSGDLPAQPDAIAQPAG